APTRPRQPAEMPSHDPLHRPGADRPAGAPRKERSARASVLRAQLFSILLDRLSRFLSEDHDPLLAPLAEHAHRLAAQVDVFPLQADQLGEAHSGGVEQLEDGAITQPVRLRAPVAVEEILQLFLGNESGKAPTEAGSFERG